MIPQAFRLKIDSSHPFAGKKHHFSWGLVIVAETNSLQWTVTVSKQASPLAVNRNRIRRQITQYFYTNRHQLDPRISFRIIVTRPQSDAADIISQLCSLLFTDH